MATFEGNAGRIAVIDKGAWASGTAYKPLDIVTNAGATFMCKKAHTSNSAPVAGAYWTRMCYSPQVVDALNSSSTADALSAKQGKVLKEMVNGKADLPAGGTEGNFVSFDENGELQDSGKKASDFANATHTHAASEVGAGTLNGAVQANGTAQANLGTAQLRNVTIGTIDLTAGTSTLAAGTVYIVYEE